MFALAAPAAACAFSGSGKESWNEALKYLGGGRPSADEAATIRAMAEPDRLAKAIEYLVEAERMAETPQETDGVARRLGGTYNQLALIQAGQKDWSSASYSMAEAIKREPNDAVLYWNLGNFQFSAGQYWESAQSFAKARDNADADLKLKSGRALIQAYMKQAQANDPNAYDYAIKEIQGMLYDHPGDLELQYQLGDNFRLKGDGKRALEVWEQARNGNPFPDAGMEQKYLQLKSAVDIKTTQNFAQDASLHFKIEFEDKAKSAELARKFLDLFEAAYDELGQKYGVRVDHVVHVTVYTGDQFDSAVRIPWAGGVHSENQIDLRINPRLDEKEYKNTIFHEYTHHLINLKAAQKLVPQWLNEGLAMHSEPALDVKPFMFILDTVLKKKRTYLPFAKIAGGFTSLPSVTHVKLAYAQGYSMVDALVERFGFDSILNVLVVLGTGQDFDESFRHVTRVSFADFEKQWFEAKMQAIENATPPAVPPVAAAAAAGAGPGFDGLEGSARPRTTPGFAPRGGPSKK